MKNALLSIVLSLVALTTFAETEYEKAINAIKAAINTGNYYSMPILLESGMVFTASASFIDNLRLAFPTEYRLSINVTKDVVFGDNKASLQKIIQRKINPSDSLRFRFKLWKFETTNIVYFFVENISLNEHKIDLFVDCCHGYYSRMIELNTVVRPHSSGDSVGESSWERWRKILDFPLLPE